MQLYWLSRQHWWVRGKRQKKTTFPLIDHDLEPKRFLLLHLRLQWHRLSWFEKLLYQLLSYHYHYVVRQLAMVGLGTAAGIAFAVTPYQRLKKYAPALYGAAVVTLLLVWLPGLSHAAKGAQRWIGVGGSGM